MNETEAQEVLRQFILAAHRIIKSGGFITDDDVFVRFPRIEVLLQISDKERAEVLVLTGISREAAGRAAMRDFQIWDANITDAGLSSSAVLNSFGPERLLEIVGAQPLLSLITTKKFWMTSPGNKEIYSRARDTIRRIIDTGLDLKIHTRGPLAYALRQHMSAEAKANLGDWLLGSAVADEMPTLDHFWNFCEVYQHLSLPQLWAVVETNILSPLGLRLPDAPPASSASASSPPASLETAPELAPVSEPAPETRLLFPTAEAGAAPLGTVPLDSAREEEPLSSRLTATPGDPAANDSAGEETRREGTRDPKAKQASSS